MTDFKFTGPKYVSPQISSPSVNVGDGNSNDASIVMPILAIVGAFVVFVWVSNHFSDKRNQYYD